jgi:hypothetical protein
MPSFTLLGPVGGDGGGGTPPPADPGPPLYWTGTNPQTGLPAGDRDPGNLRNPVPVYRTQPDQKPQQAGGGDARPTTGDDGTPTITVTEHRPPAEAAPEGAGGPGRTFTLLGPADGAGAAAAPPGGPPGVSAPSSGPGAAPPPTGLQPQGPQPAQPAYAPMPVPPREPSPQGPLVPPPVSTGSMYGAALGGSAAPPPGPAPGGMQPPPQLAQPPVQGVGPAAPPQPPMQQPAAPQRGFWGEAGHLGGLTVAQALKGAIGLPAGAIDLANLGLRQVGLGFEDPGYMSGQLNRAYNALGLPQPENQGEEWLSDVAGAVGGTLPFLPFGVAAGAGRLAMARLLARELPGAIGTGTGQYVAERGGAGTGGQLAAAVLGGMTGNLGRAAAMATASRLNLATQAGQQAAAGRILAQSSGAPATLEQRLATAPQVGLPTAPRTTAMMSGDPNLMTVERAVRATPEGSGIRAVEAQRNAAIANALQTMRTAAPQTAAQRGLAVRGILREQERAMGQRTDQLYTAARAVPGTADVRPALQDMGSITRKYFGAGGAPAPAAWTRVASQIVTRGKAPVNAEWLMNMDRQLGNEAGQAAAAGDRTTAAAFRELRDSMGQLSPNAAYDTAKAYRAQVGRVTGRDAAGAHAVGDVLASDRFGAPRTADEQVVGKIMSSPGAVRQTLDAANEAVLAAQTSGGDVARMQAARSALQTHLKDAFLEGAERQQVTGQTAALTPGGVATTVSTYSPAKWSQFWQKNEQTARELFSPAEHRTLQQITDQLGETAMVAQSSKAAGSDTAQILNTLSGKESPTVAQVLATASHGRITPDSVTGRMIVGAVNKLPALIGLHAHGGVGAMAGHVLSHDIVGALSRRPDEAIRTMLTEAASDPAFAQLLLQKANAGTITKVVQSPWAARFMTSSPVRTLGRATGATEAAYGRAPVEADQLRELRAQGEL